jgi:hypothetical protein
MAFIEGNTIGVVTGGPTMHIVVFMNTGSDYLTPEGVWNTVDVSALVPPDTKAVMLSGMLILTHGSNPDVCNLFLAYRAWGETFNYSYSGQVDEGSINGGQRLNYTDWCEIRQGKFEYKWWRTPAHPGVWPAECAYGLNIRLVAYLR